jgi:peptidoglycan/LPS O-acetylase OafA/YrhL
MIEEFIHPHLWFLLTLYGYVLILPIFQLFNKWKGIKYGIVFWGLCIICMGIIWKLTGTFKLATLYIAYFATGTILAQIKQIQSLFYQPIISAIAFLCIFLLLPFWESGNTSISNIVVKIIISFSVIIIVYNVCTLLKWYDLWDKFILSCGKYSLVIYVVHWEFLQFVNEKIFIVQNELIGFTITLIISILICKTCILFKKITETSPIIDFILFGNYSYLKNKKKSFMKHENL